MFLVWMELQSRSSASFFHLNTSLRKASRSRIHPAASLLHSTECEAIREVPLYGVIPET